MNIYKIKKYLKKIKLKRQEKLQINKSINKNPKIYIITNQILNMES